MFVYAGRYKPEAVVVGDAATRDAWVEETVAQTRARLDAFETGPASFGTRGREIYGEDVSSIAEAVDALAEDAAE